MNEISIECQYFPSTILGVWSFKLYLSVSVSMCAILKFTSFFHKTFISICVKLFDY